MTIPKSIYFLISFAVLDFVLYYISGWQDISYRIFQAVLTLSIWLYLYLPFTLKFWQRKDATAFIILLWTFWADIIYYVLYSIFVSFSVWREFWQSVKWAGWTPIGIINMISGGSYNDVIGGWLLLLQAFIGVLFVILIYKLK